MTGKTTKQNKLPKRSSPTTGEPPSQTLAKDRDERVREYVAANTATPELARAELREMGIIDDKGNLTKPYR